MNDTVIAIVATFGVVFILLAAIGLVKMPDTYLRMCVTTKASTLGIGLILFAATIFFDNAGITSRVLAIVIFLFLTVPVGAHLIARASYFIGVKLWEKTSIDELEGRYQKASHTLLSEDAKEKKQSE